MSDESQAPAPSGFTARVADSYGDDPHEHKPSQDPFDPETADEKQAETGGAPSVGNSSSSSDETEPSSPEKIPSGESSLARTTVSRTKKDRTAGRTASSTDSDPKDR